MNEIVKYAQDKNVVCPAVFGFAASLPTLALAEGTAVGVSDFQGVLTAMQGQVSVNTVVSVLTAGATASIGLVFMWWGVRKLTKMLMGAFRKGRESV